MDLIITLQYGNESVSDDGERSMNIQLERSAKISADTPLEETQEAERWVRTLMRKMRNELATPE